MGGLKAVLKISLAAIGLACALGGAAHAEAPACATFKPAANSNLIGKTWSLRQKDDGKDWAGPWTLTFTADGNGRKRVRLSANGVKAAN